MSLKTAAIAATLTLASLLPAVAQETDHSGMNHAEAMPGMAAPKGDQGPSSKAFAEASAKMHQGMAIDYTGRPDIDFAKGMIAHHQGAIDMAKVELEFGTDPQLRKLAEEVIAAQESEIATMNAWLAKNGG